MLRIHLVTWSNRKRYRRYLERYFRIRHDIYVEQRKWRAVARPINIEMDAFDTEHAIYLLAISETDKIVAATRLVPTLEPHLMSDVFPVLAANAVPRAADIFEWTRFFIVPALRTRGKSSPVAGAMLCGVLEAGLRLNLSKITIVCESYWPKRLRSLNWSFEVLGDVLEHPDGDIVAVMVDVTQEALENVRKSYGIREPVLVADNET